MSEPAQKCENYEAIFKQNYKTLKLLIALKWPIIVVSVSGKSNISQKKFYNINYRAFRLTRLDSTA